MKPENEFIKDTLPAIDAGLFIDKFKEAAKQVALGVRTTGKKGSFTMQFDVEAANGTDEAVKVKHTIKYNKPTTKGKATDENTTTSILFVGNRGNMTLSPQTQEEMEFNLAGQE